MVYISTSEVDGIKNRRLSLSQNIQSFGFPDCQESVTSL